MTDLFNLGVAETPAAAAPEPFPSGVKVVQARVSNFRGIANIEVDLDHITVLLGANNAGKSSFLDALSIAVGASRRQVGREDIHLKAGETDIPRDRTAVIDLLLVPIGPDGERIDSFPSGSFWTGLFSEAISQDDDFRDFVAFRASVAFKVQHGEYKIERKFLREWLPFSDYLSAGEKGGVSATQWEPFALHYIDAKRDMDEDLRVRTSFWRRLTDDLGLDGPSITAAEQMLNDLNTQLVSGSEVLRHVGSHLSGLKGLLASGTATVDISPVARRLRDLSKGLDVSVAGVGNLAFPLARHGMGTRSLASVLVFQAFASWRTTRALAEGNKVHSFLALEEPEAHLHPQAQRTLYSQIEEMPAQVLVSTHSPYFSSQAKLSELRLFRKEGVETKVSRMDLGALSSNDIRKLEEKIMLTRGDILFSTGLVLFEGETEEAALPIFAKREWGASIHELGLSFVPVGGGDYFAYIWLAKSLGIPWFIVSDAEPLPLATLDAALVKAGEAEHGNCPAVTIFDAGRDFEAQLIADGYGQEIERAINAIEGADDHLTHYVTMMDGQKKKGGVVRNYQVGTGRSDALLDCMRENKTRYASGIAREICSLGDDVRAVPPHLKRAFQKISVALGR